MRKDPCKSTQHRACHGDDKVTVAQLSMTGRTGTPARGDEGGDL